jgi:4'-phosphopantetheinyl transferase
MATYLPWVPAASPPTLTEKEIHVWRASLELSPAVLQRFRDILNSEEKARAERFLVSQARDHFLAARGILRELLGAYLGLNSAEITLSYGSQGKPILGGAHNSRICFNLSHSHGIGLFAFAQGGEVGVDIERVRAGFQGMQVASHFFSDAEIAALAELPPASAEESFFACWTRKEAYVKAHGEGLGIPLRSFTVEFCEAEQVIRDARGARWSCYALEPTTGFVGAVVVAGENWKLKLWEWSVEEEKILTPCPAIVGNNP